MSEANKRLLRRALEEIYAQVEPTGRAFAVRHVYLWRIEDGMIAEHWGSRDDLGMLGQLGLLPEQD